MWSGCRDLNSGPLDPQSSALTKLRHSPLSIHGSRSTPTAWCRGREPVPLVLSERCPTLLAGASGRIARMGTGDGTVIEMRAATLQAPDGTPLVGPLDWEVE